MNIFLLDDDPVKCAEYHLDKHCVKMVLETAQLLCSAFPQGEAPYRKTHVNHPCSIWTRHCKENYYWLIKLGKSLSDEYTHRYGKVHKSSSVIEWCAENYHKLKLPEMGGVTRFALAMPDHYKVDSPVESYRNYYMGDKAPIAKWTRRNIPYWFKPES